MQGRALHNHAPFIMIDISKALSIPGWMSETELNWLAKTAQQCRVIVEFGSHCGRSTRALADHMNNGILFAVDTWSDIYFNDNGSRSYIITRDHYNDFRNNLLDHIERGVVIPKRMKSRDFTMAGYADLVFIDGDHRYEYVCEDIKKALRITKSGSIIAGHDYGVPEWPGVKSAVDFFFADKNIVDTIWWIRRS